MMTMIRVLAYINFDLLCLEFPYLGINSRQTRKISPSKMLLTPLRTTIVDLQRQQPTNLEIEVRYGTFIEPKTPLDRPRFQPGVSIQTFSRLQSNLARIAPQTITRSHDEAQDDIRHTTYEDGREVWISKGRPLLTRDIKEYGLRVSATQENPVQPPRNFKPNYIRDKIRYSYPLAGGAVRADLTRVSSDNRVTYEVELEMVQPNSFDAFSKAAELILKVIQDTAVLYTEKDRREVTSYFNNLLAGHNDSSRLDHGVIKQARNLKLKDMVWGGLIGNEKTGYVVNHKPDGTRRLLVFAPNGIWLLHPPHEYTRLTAENFPTMTGTVLDGELIPKEKRKAQAPIKPYWYLAIDTLAWQSDIGAQKQPHNDRMQLAQLAIDRLESPFLAVNTMKFKSFNTPRKFFEVMRNMFEEQPALAYAQDGFIFTPESAEYNPKYPFQVEGQAERIISIDQFPLYQRTLVNYADNLKWKELTNLTIDFLIRKAQRGVELYSLKDRENVLFTGSREHPFSGFIPEVPAFIADVPNDSIVEFRWENNTFVPVVIRTNKLKPNRLEIALDIWDDIHNPISQELLSGKTFDLAEYYFSRIRRGLLFTRTDQEVLLVLNAGLSEDLSRWRNYRRVIAYEDNPDLRTQLQERLVTQHLDRKVSVVGTFDEIKEKVDVIVLMYDVGRFWQSREQLEQLAALVTRSLAPSGRLMFFILDGDAVQEMFKPAYTPQFDIKGLDLGPALLTYNQDQNKLETNYPGTQLEDKVETPVFIYDLIARVSGSHITEIHRADTEDFLSLPEKMLSRLQTFGLVETNGQEGQVEPTIPPTEPAQRLNVAETIEGMGTGRPEIPAVVEERPETVTSPKLVNSPAILVTPTNQTTRDRPLPVKTRVAPTRGTITTTTTPGRGRGGLPPRTLPARGGVTGRGAPLTRGRGGLPTRGRGGAPRAPIERPLRTLTVLAPRPRDLPGIGDDKLERLTVTWTDEEVYRIACIGDGSCFFHSYLKGFYAPYQNNNSYAFRYNIVRDFRDELATLITEVDPDSPDGRLFYETASNGNWVEFAEQQLLEDEPLLDDFKTPLDYSLDGMVQLFMSTRDVGDEVYSFVSEIVGIGCYVVRGTNLNVYPQISVGIENPSVVIIGNGRHYEVVAVKRQEGLQTLFDPDDPFLQQLRALAGTEGRTAITPTTTTEK